jgi:hypothetical protein
MKSTVLLTALLLCLQMAPAQDLSRPSRPSYRVEAQVGASLLGRDAGTDCGVEVYEIQRNEMWRVGAAGWRTMGKRFYLGGAVGYARNRMAFQYRVFSSAWRSGEAEVRLHALSLAPAIRWQRKADRGIFAQVALDIHISLGESGWNRRDGVVQKEALPVQGIAQDALQIGPELSLGYLFPIGRGQALGLRAMAGWYKRDFVASNGYFYFPTGPWSIRPGLCLGWNFGL